MEWSGGRAESLAAKALKDPDDTAFRSRLATGLTYTTTNKISLSAEYEYNGTGLKLPDWNSLRHGPLAAYGLYRTVAASLQELPTSDNVFLYAVWQDALIKNFDLTAMVRNDLVDHSQQHWLEARYHWPKVDIALQIQVNKGDPTSTYGVLPYRSLWQAVARYYF
jgi:hypothetical protein